MTNTIVEKMVQKYWELNGNVISIADGSGRNLTICYGRHLRTAVIREVKVGHNAYTYSVNLYDDTPARYRALVQKWNEAIYADI